MKNRFNFAATTISDVWVPEVWIPGVAEPVIQQPTLLNSGIVARSPRLDEIASGGGTTANLPNLREPDHDDEVQKVTGPTVNGIGHGRQVAPILRRVNTLGSKALAQAQIGLPSNINVDLVGFITWCIHRQRMRQRQRTLLAQLRGIFGTAFADMGFESFSESVAAQTSAHFIDGVMFNDATALLGEAKEMLDAGAMICHPDIEKALNNQDDITTEKDSDGRIRLRRYKGQIPLFVSDLLVRPGVTDGKVYDTYIFAPGTVGMGDKPQSSDVGDSASLLKKEDEHLNEITFYDRTQFVLHPNGARWVPAIATAEDSPSNAELQTALNWQSALSDVRHLGIVQLTTNG